MWKRTILNKMPWTIRKPLLRIGTKSPWTPGNRELNCIFIHIPRTGGSSLADAIFGRRFGHPYLYDFVAHDEQQAADAFKFAIVRHPACRLISAYQQMQKQDINPLAKRVWKSLGIHSFAELIRRLESRRLKSQVFRLAHFRPQAEMVACPSMDLDFVGRFEDLEAAFSTIEERLGISMSVKTVNSSSRVSDERYLHEHSLRVIANAYRTDYSTFGYADAPPMS